MPRFQNLINTLFGPPSPACPYCHAPMLDVSRVSQGESTNSVWSCIAESCPAQPVYRRVDIDQPAHDRDAAARAEILADQARTLERLTQLENMATTWVANNYPRLLDGTRHPIRIIVDMIDRRAVIHKPGDIVETED